MSRHKEGEDDSGEVFLDDNDIIHEIDVDEDLPDADEEAGMDLDICELVCCTALLLFLVCFALIIGGIEWIRWHPRGHLVLAGSEDNTVWMWNADKNVYLNMFTGHGGSVTCGDFTPDGKTICTGSDDTTLRIWNPKNGENLHIVKDHPYHREGLTCLTISCDSLLAITGAKDGSVHMVNIASGKVISSLMAHTDSIECIGLSPSFPWLATGSMDQKLILWDLEHSSPRSTCDHEEGVTCIAWLGTSRFIATGTADGKIRIWDSLSGDCAKTFYGHEDAIQGLSVSATAEFLVSASLDGTARVFEIAEYR